MSRQLSDHPEELLPWVVNGSLEGEERRRVEEHLASCLACRREVKQLQELRQEVKQASAASPPGEAGLERLMRRAARDRAPARGSWRPLIGALAAALVAAVGIGWWTLMEAPAPPRLRAEEAALVRSLVPPDKALARDSFILSWQPGPAARGARFDVRVKTRQLEPVAEERGLEVPEYQVPATNLADLPPGARLYWQVEVVSPDGSRLRSETFRARLE